MDDEEESYHLQSADNTLATASHSTYLTPCSGARNKPFSQPNQINIVTPPESNIAPVTTRLTGTPKKCAPSDGHPDCIDLSKDDNDDTMEDMGRKKATVIIKIDQDGDDLDAERGTTIDDKMIPGLGTNGVTASVDWNNLTDSEIIRRTVYGPDVPSYELAVVGNGRGSIYNDKIKTLNLGIWLNV